MLAPYLTVEDVVRRYPARRLGGAGRGAMVQALSGVSFQVERGRTFGLVGESGCGKSTLARLLVGLETPTAGRIALEGRDLSTLDREGRRWLRQRVQLVMQDPGESLNPRLRVGPIVAEPLVAAGAGDRRARGRRVEEALEQVGLEGSAGRRFPHEFSGGQRQRIAIARALVVQPQLMVLDEPTASLDVSIRGQIVALLQDLQRAFHLTYVLISHDLGLVRHVADVVGIMYLGRLMECGPADTVFQAPLHPYTAALLDAEPRLGRARPGLVLGGELPSPIHPPGGCVFHPRCPVAEPVCRERDPGWTAAGPGSVRCHFPARAARADLSA